MAEKYYAYFGVVPGEVTPSVYVVRRSSVDKYLDKEFDIAPDGVTCKSAEPSAAAQYQTTLLSHVYQSYIWSMWDGSCGLRPGRPRLVIHPDYYKPRNSRKPGCRLFGYPSVKNLVHRKYFVTSEYVMRLTPDVIDLLNFHYGTPSMEKFCISGLWVPFIQHIYSIGQAVDAKPKFAAHVFRSVNKIPHRKIAPCYKDLMYTIEPRFNCFDMEPTVLPPMDVPQMKVLQAVPKGPEHIPDFMEEVAVCQRPLPRVVPSLPCVHSSIRFPGQAFVWHRSLKGGPIFVAPLREVESMTNITLCDSIREKTILPTGVVVSLSNKNRYSVVCGVGSKSWFSNPRNKLLFDRALALEAFTSLALPLSRIQAAADELKVGLILVCASRFVPWALRRSSMTCQSSNEAFSSIYLDNRHLDPIQRSDALFRHFYAEPLEAAVIMGNINIAPCGVNGKCGRLCDFLLED
jgi:hypothetical protein